MRHATTTPFRSFFHGVATFLIIASGLVAIGVSAALAPTICPHNVCTETLTIGGQELTYSYTQHISPGGQLRVRFAGGEYDTASLISYMIFNLPQFDTWSVLADTVNGAIALPDEDVNPSRTAFERSHADGCSDCIVDMVLAVDFPVSVGPGAYTFGLNVIQNGDSAGRNALAFYVHELAPSGRDESEPFFSTPGVPATQDMDEACADLEPYEDGVPFDNNLNYLANCADPSCDGAIGSFAPMGYCEAVETTCYDGFDNDGDGLTDCADPSCDGRVGRLAPLGFCQHSEEGGTFFGNDPELGYINAGPINACTDGFDNDGDDDLPDGGLDCMDNRGTVSCWKNEAFGCPATETSCTDGIDNDHDQSYSLTGAWDKNVATGADCEDYDCAGHPSCPAFEHVDADGNSAEAQCFDGDDNDLDGLIDCADVNDCFGVIGPGGQVCLEFEFSLAQGIQHCADAFDNDGDGPADCSDTDCSRAFGSCGPCPSREDYAYASCADGRDNDNDVALLGGGLDCGDPDCIGGAYPRLGSLGGQVVDGRFAHAAHCAASENTDRLCGDGVDNDANGLIDCADPACAGNLGPNGQICQVTESICNDGLDNDTNGLIDCADPACFGSASCAAPWVVAPVCRDLPEWTGPLTFTGNDPTITANVIVRGRVNADHLVRLIGTGTYDAVAVVIGDNTDPSQYYPFASAAGCSIDAGGQNAAEFSLSAIDGRFVQLSAATPGMVRFDIIIRCPTGPVPMAASDVPLSLSALKSSSVPEYGDLLRAIELMEGVAPSVSAIEPEGLVGGAVVVPFGSSFSYRVVPSDPPVSSGICGCSTLIDGDVTDSADGSCSITTVSGNCGPSLPYAYCDDIESVSVQGRAEDGADNVSPWSAALAFEVDVRPVAIAQTAILSPSTPFIRAGENQVGLSARFRTGTTDTFNGTTCTVHVYDASGAQRGDLINGIGAIPNGTPMANEANCSGAVTPALDLATYGDGEYFLAVRVQDSDGDYVESNRKAIYWCDSIPGPGDPETPCSKADFDRDGATEGLYTTLYSPTPRACDNCVGLSNPDQTDNNANGIGDMCQPGQVGRCEVDRLLLCDCGALPDFTEPNATVAEEFWRNPLDPITGLLTGLDETSFTAGECQLTCPAASEEVDRYFDPENYDEDIHQDDGRKKEQRCMEQWGVCQGNGEFCFNDAECTTGGVLACANRAGTLSDPFVSCTDSTDCGGFNTCVGGFGTCAGDAEKFCRRDIDCGNQEVDGPCIGADICTDMLSPWIQTSGGNVFSGFRISAPDVPPHDNVNATFCVTAKDTIVNFVTASGECPAETVPDTRFALPKRENAFRTVLGTLDVEGLLAGKHGSVVTLTSDDDINTMLGGNVYVHEGDLVIGNPSLGSDQNPGLPLEFMNGIGSGSGRIGGHGTIVVNEGNLIINRDITYGISNISELAHLASVAWVVLDDGSGTKGNIFVHRNVRELAGVFYADGASPGMQMHGYEQFASNIPLTVRGLIIARRIVFSRDYRSFDQGSERVIYDGRAVVNPPPGFGDVSKVLPQFIRSSF